MTEKRSVKNTSREPDVVIRKATADIFFAMFINQLLINTATLFDSFIVSRFYGEIALSSTGIIYQLIFFLITLGSVFSIGSQLECSISLSNGDQHRVNSIFTASLALIGIISAVLAAVLLLFSGQAVSLSIEEIIALLTGQHDKKNKVHIDLFVTAEDECIRIRIRSYGKLFDPLSKEQQEEQWDLDDIRKTIVSRVADEVEYNTSLGVNNIIVTVNTGDRNA